MTISKLSGVVCCGNICLDIPVRPVDRIDWGTTTWVESISQSIGGNGANTSYTLGRLGVPVALFGRTGSDTQGDWLRERLANAGVNISGVKPSSAPTTSTVALVNSAGNRLFLHRVGSSTEVSAADVAFPGHHSHFHLANLFALPNVRLEAGSLMARAKAAGFTTSLDTGWDARGLWMEHVGPCLPQTDVLFVNEDESAVLSGSKDPEKAAETLMNLGARSVITKLGALGCIVSNGSGHIAVPGFPATAVDTTGCGDCFAGGFLAGLHHGWTYAESARFGNAIGALNVQELGAVSGVRSFEETTAWMKSQSKLKDHP